MTIGHRPDATRRRSGRVVAELPIRVLHDGVESVGQTAVVNLEGGLILCGAAAAVGATLVVTNAVTGESVPCRVVWEGEEAEDGSHKYGIELLEARPEFWGIELPPE